ncbi:MAG TPA: guanylate kinase [Steroidobacteraceae bacterium]|jgi:guanylate kinase|nr:guanylate kinase [Steroidobacteraceae bacterium]
MAAEPLPLMKRGHLYVIAAPSGAGKTSLLRAVMAKRPNIGFSVSCTTRKPRPGEVDGRDYHFISRPDFERLVDAGEFVEHADVFGNLYGTRRSVVEGALAEGRDLILEIDWQGARQVRERLPEAVQVFILPPSRAELEKRLRGRGSDSEEAIARRLAESAVEMSHWQEFDYVIVNRDFEAAVAELEAIFDGHGEASRRDRPELAALARELLGT